MIRDYQGLYYQPSDQAAALKFVRNLTMIRDYQGLYYQPSDQAAALKFV